MFRQTGQYFHVISQSYVKVFSAGVWNRYWYPYRMVAVHEADDRTRTETMEYFLDSGIRQEERTNELVIEKMEELNPNYVVPKDYIGDQDKTTEGIEEFLEMYEQSDAKSTIVIPLQPPHAEHYRELEEKFGHFSHYGLGGVADWDPTEKVEAVRTFWKRIDDRPYVHAFGVGGNLPFFKAIRNDPIVREAVDSIDTTTPEQMARNGRMADAEMTQYNFIFPNGTDSGTIRSQYADSTLLMMNYMLSPLCDDEILDQEAVQSVFG